MTEPLKAGIHCPACGCEDWDTFYRVERIPVHSCLLLPTQKEALAFPRADLELAVCPQCAFIWNTQFDSRYMAYAPEYQDQQCFSPTFDKFARSLSAQMVERYELYQKDIIEIGCGKGDFLSLLCRLGNNRGVGIDPSVAPNRQQESAAGIVWVAEYFARHHERFPADFVCCRHTLEHIQEVSSFLHLLQQVLGNRSVPVLFEVPDVMRVLEHCALEDIYYEHCSYFTPGSLARLFRRRGFAVADLYLAYGDQYALLEAQPARAEPQPAHPREEPVADTLLAVEAFRNRIDDKKRFWRGMLGSNACRKLAVWGSGSKCVALLSMLDIDTEGLCVVDINPHRHGKFLPGTGLEIKPPEYLRHHRPQRVIVMNRIYEQEIGERLRQLDVKAEVTTL